VEDVLGQDDLALAHRGRLSLEEARELQRSLRVTHAALPLPATLLLHNACLLRPLSLRLAVLDELLGGGLWAGEVTEVIGRAASGKTALCLQACAAVLTEPVATVAFVDSSNAFTPSRLLPLLSDTDFTEAMNRMARLCCWRLHDGHALLALLNQFLADLANPQQETPFLRHLRLLVVDSAASLISPLLSSTPIGHSLVSSISRALRLLATRHNFVVLVTNYTVGSEREAKPALGELWGMTSSTRLFLQHEIHPVLPGEESQTSKRYGASLLKSPHTVHLRAAWVTR